MGSPEETRQAQYLGGQTPDYDVSRLGEMLPSLVGRICGQQDAVLDTGTRAGERAGRQDRRPGTVAPRTCKRLSPTNSERLNRALKELSPSAFKIHTLLWKWRGAPAKGHLPFFTVHGLSTFCGMTRPTVRSGLRELVRLGWIRKQGYNKHIKNELYSLTPIRNILMR